MYSVINLTAYDLYIYIYDDDDFVFIYIILHLVNIIFTSYNGYLSLHILKISF